MSSWIIIISVGVLVALSVAFAPRRVSVEGFFSGLGAQGTAPGLMTLILSQVTTWIFARSLMNSAILGYYYGIAGTLAYAAYYGSFLSGAFIVGRMRENGDGSVQQHLGARFGGLGTGSYNLVIALRLLSEVFSNLIVVSLIFAALLPKSPTQAHWQFLQSRPLGWPIPHGADCLQPCERMWCRWSCFWWPSELH